MLLVYCNGYAKIISANNKPNFYVVSIFTFVYFWSAFVNKKVACLKISNVCFSYSQNTKSVPLPHLLSVVIYCNFFCFSVAVTDLLAYTEIKCKIRTFYAMNLTKHVSLMLQMIIIQKQNPYNFIPVLAE
jgi:hypothetical protein